MAGGGGEGLAGVWCSLGQPVTSVRDAPLKEHAGPLVSQASQAHPHAGSQKRLSRRCLGRSRGTSRRSSMALPLQSGGGTCRLLRGVPPSLGSCRRAAARPGLLLSRRRRGRPPGALVEACSRGGRPTGASQLVVVREPSAWCRRRVPSVLGLRETHGPPSCRRSGSAFGRRAGPLHAAAPVAAA